MSDTVSQEQIERFWSKVDKSPGLGPGGDCWQWAAGTKNKEGYGGFYLKQIDNTINSHKFAFLIAHNFGLNDIPQGIVVRHLCDNPKCVRPEHLALGTYKDNSEDMVKAGRSQRGVINSKAVLNWDKVRSIRSKWATGDITKSGLAREFGIKHATVWQVVTNQTWKDPSYVPIVHEDARHKGCRYGDEIVGEIHRLRAEGMSGVAIADKVGVSVSQTYNIIRGDQRKGGVA